VIADIDGAFRRSKPRLATIPIRWRGETRRALTVLVATEHEVAPGVWQPSPSRRP
jgi:hypothetical protein